MIYTSNYEWLLTLILKQFSIYTKSGSAKRKFAMMHIY